MGRLGYIFRRWRGGSQPGDAHTDHEMAHPDDAWPIPMQGAEDTRAAAAQIEAAGMEGHPDDWFFGAASASQPEAPNGGNAETQDAPAISGGQSDWTIAEATDVDALFPADVHDFRRKDDACPTVIPEFPTDDEPEPAAQPRDHIDGRLVDPTRRIALLRAARIVGFCDIAERRQRQRAMWRLATLVEAFPHGASIRAIENLAAEGATIDEIEAAGEIKALWSQDPALWLVRRRDGLRGRMAATSCSSLRNAMTWRLSFRLLQRWPERSAEDLLAGDLLDRWMHMRATGHLREEGMLAAYCSYPVFLAQAIRDEKLDNAEEPFESHRSGWHCDGELDALHWNARRAHRSDVLRREGWLAPPSLLERALLPSIPKQADSGAVTEGESS